LGKTVPVFFGQVVEGRLKMDNPHAYMVRIAALNGKRVELVLRKRRCKRTLPQNAYYWGVVIEILRDHFGYDAEEMHDALKFEFLRIRNDRGGPDSVKSTADLSTEEFAEYVKRVVRWAAQKYRVYIPDPGSVE